MSTCSYRGRGFGSQPLQGGSPPEEPSWGTIFKLVLWSPHYTHTCKNTHPWAYVYTSTHTRGVYGKIPWEPSSHQIQECTPGPMWRSNSSKGISQHLQNLSQACGTTRNQSVAALDWKFQRMSMCGKLHKWKELRKIPWHKLLLHCYQMRTAQAAQSSLLALHCFSSPNDYRCAHPPLKLCVLL